MATDIRFDRELAAALRANVPPGAVTVIVARPEPLAASLLALGRLVGGLERHGIPHGRRFVLVVGHGRAGGAARLAAEVGRALGPVAIAHDPDRSPCYVAGRVAGAPVEVDDELREAEAVVFAGPLDASAGDERLFTDLMRGLVSRATVALLGDDEAAWREAARLLEPSVGFGWDAVGEARVVPRPAPPGG